MMQNTRIEVEDDPFTIGIRKACAQERQPKLELREWIEILVFPKCSPTACERVAGLVTVSLLSDPKGQDRRDYRRTEAEKHRICAAKSR
jgi:hypothetical protein